MQEDWVMMIQCRGNVTTVCWQRCPIGQLLQLCFKNIPPVTATIVQFLVDLKTAYTILFIILVFCLVIDTECQVPLFITCDQIYTNRNSNVKSISTNSNNLNQSCGKITMSLVLWTSTSTMLVSWMLQQLAGATLQCEKQRSHNCFRE
jgi:hypothetical protein